MKIAVSSLLGLACLLLPTTQAQRPAPDLRDPNLSPAQQAQEYFHLGTEAVQKVAALEVKRAEMEPGENQAKIDKKISKAWDKAITNFNKATKSFPSMFQAHEQLCLAHYAIGEYDAALAACDQSLEMAPNLKTAILTRAETYLALNRPGDAQTEFGELSRRDEGLAGELLESMKIWLETRRQDPAGVDSEALDQLQAWIAER